ncbi:MAG: glycosyltransferase family 39 protein, partial [Anaerolineae bacterium]|nr:glycosyltransferase family 39 protein [Anaerolineae bacterium]
MNGFVLLQRRGGLLLILLIAALLSGYLVMERRHMNADTLYYLIPARNFFEGRGLTYAGDTHTLFPPGYGIISYPFYVLIGDFEWTGALVSLGAYLVLIGLAYGVSRFLYHDVSALLAAFWVAIAPVILWHSYQALSDLVYAVLYISIYALFLHIVIHRNTFFQNLILGILCGMLYLTRPEGLAVGGLVFLGLIIRVWQQKSNFKWIGVFLIPWLLLVGAYILFLHDAEGQWTISGKVRQNIIRDEYVEGTVSDYEELSVGEFIQQQGWKYVQTTTSNFIQGTILFLGINRHVFFVWGIVWVLYRRVCKRWLPVLQW